MDIPSKPIIIKLGGAVISHSNKLIDYNYLREFRDLLRENIALGKRFVIAVGGGQTMRNYMEHAIQQGNVTSESDLHWIGTAVNTLHAYMVKAFLGNEICEENVWKFTDRLIMADLPFNKPVQVVGGFEAGRSGDWVALEVAKALNTKTIIDLKNVDGVFDSDPKVNQKAKMFNKLTWEKYLTIIGNPTEHKPGGNMPVDPIAAREAKEYGATYYIIKATDFDSLERAINNQEFKGSIITDN